MAQEQSPDPDKPPGDQLLNLIALQNPVSLENFPQKEAFLVGKSILDSQVAQIEVQVLTDIKICKELFNKFSPQDTIFATWDFRYAWHLGYNYLPCFIVVFFDKKAVGLLPLWYEHDKKQFRWFGSYWMEDNSFWVFDKKYIPLLLSICPSRTYLNAITLDSKSFSKILNLKQDEAKYTLNLTRFNSSEDFLQALNKKKRYNLKRDWKQITNQKPKIIINRFKDLSTFFDLSIQRFGVDSDCTDPKRRETYKQILKQAKTYQVRMITTEIKDKIASVDLVFLFKDTYYAAKGSNNINLFPGIGHFVNLFQIKDALALGYKKIDFLQHSYGWKEELFTSIPLYCFKKNLKTKEVEI